MPGWVSSRSAEGVLVVWERELAAGGWLTGGEPEEEVASGVVDVWEEVLCELGLVGGGPVSSGRSWWALGDAGAWRGVFKVCRGRSGGSGRENWQQVAGRMVENLQRRWRQESWGSGSRFWVSWAWWVEGR